MNKLWMGNIDTTYDEGYIRSLFTDENILSVKIIRDKNTGLPVGYAFIDFEDNEAAQRVIIDYNGKIMDDSGKVFRLNWAQYSNTREVDYSIFVGDLGPNVTDAMLYETFVIKFPSCSAAKVVVDPATGRNKGYGFVKFSYQVEMEQALEMNGTVIGGQPIRVSRAIRKNRKL